MYIETSQNNHNTENDDVFVSWERTDIIHISNITFYHNRFSTSDAVKRNMGKLDIQLLRNGSWETEYSIEKILNFSVDATLDFIKFRYNFTTKLWNKTII